MKILVAGNMAVAQLIERSFLGRSGWQVLTCRTGGEILERAGRDRPDLIVVGDVAEPDAVETWTRLKAGVDTAGLQVLLLVADPQRSSAPSGAVMCPLDDARQIVDRIGELLAVPRRADPRRLLKLRVDCFGPGDQEGVGHTRDLSTSGMFLRSDLDLTPGDAVQLIFGLPLPGRPTIRAAGEVVHRRGSAAGGATDRGIGIRFRRVGERDRQTLAGLIDAGRRAKV